MANCEWRVSRTVSLIPVYETDCKPHLLLCKQRSFDERTMKCLANWFEHDWILCFQRNHITQLLCTFKAMICSTPQICLNLPNREIVFSRWFHPQVCFYLFYLNFVWTLNIYIASRRYKYCGEFFWFMLTCRLRTSNLIFSFKEKLIW